MVVSWLWLLSEEPDAAKRGSSWRPNDRPRSLALQTKAPKPSVPATAQRSPRRSSACASHHVQVVFPLVPVTAKTLICLEGRPA